MGNPQIDQGGLTRMVLDQISVLGTGVSLDRRIFLGLELGFLRIPNTNGYFCKPGVLFVGGLTIRPYKLGSMLRALMFEKSHIPCTTYHMSLLGPLTFYTLPNTVSECLSLVGPLRPCRSP